MLCRVFTFHPWPFLTVWKQTPGVCGSVTRMPDCTPAESVSWSPMLMTSESHHRRRIKPPGPCWTHTQKLSWQINGYHKNPRIVWCHWLSPRTKFQGYLRHHKAKKSATNVETPSRLDDSNGASFVALPCMLWSNPGSHNHRRHLNGKGRPSIGWRMYINMSQAQYKYQWYSGWQIIPLYHASPAISVARILSVSGETTCCKLLTQSQQVSETTCMANSASLEI